MRTTTLTLTATIAVATAICAPAVADSTRVISAQSAAPTQTEIGHYAADFKLQTWKAEAKAANQSFPDYVRTGLTQKFASKNIPAIVDPSGQVRMLDGHHKLTALRTIERTMGIKVPVHINVVHNYRGQPFAAYAKHLVGKLGKGYFGAKPPRSAIDKVKSLPVSFDKLRDNPLRSVLGVVFTKSGLEGSWFSDYIQFHLGEKMLAGGLGKELGKLGLAKPDGSLHSQAAADPRVIRAVTRRLFADAKLVAFLRKNVKPGAESASARRGLMSASKRAKLTRRLRAKPARATSAPRRDRRVHRAVRRRSPRRGAAAKPRPSR